MAQIAQREANKYNTRAGRQGTKKWRRGLTVEDDDVARVGVDLLGLEDLARVRGRVGTNQDRDAFGGGDRGGALQVNTRQRRAKRD